MVEKRWNFSKKIILLNEMGVQKEKYMKIERIWAMPSRWTFTIKPIKELLQREVISGQKWIDPFAGYNSPATCRNDVDPEANAEYHEDALEFLKRQSDDEDFLFDGALFDPPYSSTQAKRKYHMLEKDFTAEMGRKEYWSKCKREIARMVRPGGRVISFGWNSGGMGKNLGFELEYVLLVPHGAGRNDTIVTLETKL